MAFWIQLIKLMTTAFKGTVSCLYNGFNLAGYEIIDVQLISCHDIIFKKQTMFVTSIVWFQYKY